jgi:hypothetical protein
MSDRTDSPDDSVRAPRLEPSAKDPEIWTALGQLTIYFALLEDQMRFSIWALIGSEEQEPARIMMARKPFAALVDMLCSLCLLRRIDPDRVKALRKELDHVGQERNRYVHSDWGVGQGPGSAMRFRHTAKAKEGLRFSYENVTAADIRALADEISSVATRIAWIQVPGGSLPPSLR